MIYKGLRRINRLIRDLPIQRKLILSFLFLITFPALLIGLFSFYRSSELLVQKTSQYTRDILLETGNNIEVKLKEAERISFQIVSNIAIHDALKKSNTGFASEQERITSEREIDAQLMGLSSSVPGIAAIQVVSQSGISYYINPGSLSLNTLKMSEAQRRVLEEEKGGICWFDTDPDTQTIALGRMINSHVNQKRIGYVFIYLKESSIFNTFSETELFSNGELFVINPQGSIISCKDKEMLGRTSQYTSSDITDNVFADNFSTAKIDGRNYYVTYRGISGTSWRIFSFIPAVEYDKEVIWLRNWIWFIILAACLLSVAFSFAISNGISKPVRDLSKMMIKIGDGDFNVYSAYESKDEIGVLSLHFNEMVDQVKHLIRKAYQEELLKQKAELKSLRMQINPHFLYNTLESINWMARIHGIPEVGKMVKALGDLMRASIGGDDFITVEEELKNINNYLTIQKFRYGDKVKTEMQIEPTIMMLKVPKLILQPIVENAIVHGIENKVGDGKIEITGKNLNDRILLQVRDDGLGMEENMIEAVLSDKGLHSSEKHTHIGLKNVDRRIRMYYGEENRIQVASRSGEGTVVSISIPIGAAVS